MRVSMTPEAEAYIRSRGGSVMILVGTMSGCCGGVSPMPHIRLGQPQKSAGFERHAMGDATVFVDVRLDPGKQIEISVAKLLWWKTLSVDLT